MGWFLRLVKGIVISLGFILPGVSGGVLAAILGIYERMLRFLAHPARQLRSNLLYFLPVAVGGVLGLVLLSRPLEYLLDQWQVVVLWGFAGAILGTLPALGRESVARSRRDGTDVAWLVGTFTLALVVLYLLPAIVGTVPATFLGFALAGALIALGVLVPGLSPSNLLLILGLFTPMLQGFRDRDLFGTFLPIALGAVAAILLFSRLMERMIDRHHSRVYHAIVGLVLASTVLIVVPTHSAETIDYAGAGVGTAIMATLALAVGLVLGRWTAMLENRYKTVTPGSDDGRRPHRRDDVRERLPAVCAEGRAQGPHGG
jgi:putative membrane protein